MLNNQYVFLKVTFLWLMQYLLQHLHLFELLQH